jgi:hypothetical protein
LARGELEIGRDEDEPTPAEELDQALASFGLVLDDPADSTRPRIFCLWPEHEEVLGLWFAVQTQWRVGMGGATGLDYCGVEALMRVRQIGRGKARSQLMADLQIMERAALSEWAEEARRRERKK